ncbi:hypothetical protein QTV44_002584 [Vibrio vulnificus]|nr:hypothetical protein [Vibrio vulnificus]
MSQNDMQSGDSLFQKNLKAKKNRNKWIAIIFIGLFIGVAVILTYINSSNKAAELAKNQKTSTPVKAKHGASQVEGKAQAIDTDGTPTQRIVKQVDDAKRETAKDNGSSFIDSSKVLEAKTRSEEKRTAAIEQKQEEKATEVREKTAKTEEKAPELTREQLLAIKARELMQPVHYLRGTEPSPALAKIADDFQAKYVNTTEKNYIRHGQSVVSENPHFIASITDKGSSDSTSGNTNSNNTTALEDEAAMRSVAKQKDQVRVLDMGEMTIGEITQAINSDHALDVFIDITQPPLQSVRLRAKFELDQWGEGLMLRINRLQMGDHNQSVSGYALNVDTDMEPIFAHDVDKHYFQRYAARASAAFITPWIDFVSATTTTISNGTVIIEDNGVDNAKDRMIGGVASVAKEFLPELSKRSNRPYTIKIPRHTRVGVVFSEPLYMPKGLFDEDDETEPDLSYDKIFGNQTISYR